MILAAQHAQEWLDQLEDVIAEFMPNWPLAPMVQALQALREIRLVTAATIMAEIGDLRRFDAAGRLMSYLGLVPGERPPSKSSRGQ
jgi:transposase